MLLRYQSGSISCIQFKVGFREDISTTVVRAFDYSPEVDSITQMTLSHHDN
jgi:hypothetical protein